MATEFFVGKSYERVVDPTDPQDRVIRIFKVVGRDTEDGSVEFAHFHDFSRRDEAEELLDRIEDAGIGRRHLEDSEHWEKVHRDTRSPEERFIEQTERETREAYRRQRRRF